MLFTKHGYITLTDSTGNAKFLTDITANVSLPEFIKNSQNCDPYLISDSDTPESIAYGAYEDSKLSWVILLVNGIKNVHDEWPLDVNSFNQMLDLKYGTTISLFLNLTSIKKYDIKPGDVLKTQLNSRAEVVRWDASLSKLSVKVLSGSFAANALLYSFDTNQEIAQIARVVNYEVQSLHHFERNGIWIDPLLGHLQEYLKGNNFDVITNEEYEAKLNNDKRSIFVPKRYFAKQIYDEYARLIS
jgi:hypothetical protein